MKGTMTHCSARLDESFFQEVRQMYEQTDKRNQINVSLEDCPGDKISATDLADFLIEQLSDDRFVRKSPFIASV